MLNLLNRNSRGIQKILVLHIKDLNLQFHCAAFTTDMRIMARIKKGEGKYPATPLSER
jgi:hypothetical protein